MKFYIDFDDCLCETARRFSALVKDMFGKTVPYEDIRFFDLQRSFSLPEEDYKRMMVEGHRPEVLLSIEETPGAVGTVNGWIDSGHDVSIITGRPYSAYEASRTWLDRHGLERVKLYCLNKYGWESFTEGTAFGLEIADYKKMHFDYAIEDSPSAFRFFEHLPNLQVMVIDRPWNQACDFPGENYRRCFDWDTIRDFVKKGEDHEKMV